MSEAAPARTVGASRTTLLREWGLVILVALIPALPLLAGSGIVNTRAGGDSPFLLVRLQQMELSLRAGAFPVRWMPQAAYGLGYPFFNFYAALPYYLAALLKLAGIGYIWSIKLTQTLGFVFAALAMYGLVRELGYRRAASLLSAAVYSCAPFHMVNAYVRGDSLSEFYAFIFYPLTLWTLLRLSKATRSGTGWRLLTSLVGPALAYGGLVLTHNLSAFIFTPFLVLYLVLLGWSSPPGSRARTWLAGAAALVGGLLLSAWFWVPALVERRYVSLQDMTTGYFHYALHFRGPDLVQPSLAFQYIITADQNPFRMGLLQATLAVVALVLLVLKWRRTRRIEIQETFAALVLAGSTFMITPWSHLLWERLPLLPMVQFPWRFLSIQALGTGLLAATLVPRGHPRRRVIALALGVVVLLSALAQLRIERLLIHEDDVTAQRLLEYEYFTANVGTTIRNDWLPQWVDPRPFTSESLLQAGSKPAPLTVEGQVASTALAELGPVSEKWLIDVTSPDALLAFQTYYYPGWRAQVDGHVANVQALPGAGYIGLRLSQGQHEVHLQLGRTRLRLAAELLSIAALTLMVALLVWRARSHTSTRRTLFAVCLVALLWASSALLAVLLSSAAEPSEPIALSGRLDLTMDFDRIPYLHHNPDGIRFANTTRCTGYAVSSTEVEAGDAVIVTTYWDSGGQDLKAQVSLVSPARHLFGVPLTVASSEQSLVAGRLQHPLMIPETTMRGVYLLRLEVFNSDEEIRPTDTRDQTLGTTYLVPVRVSRQTQVDPGQPGIAQFGEHIRLMQVETTQDHSGWLDITLAWRTATSLPQNYKVALRLRDSALSEVGRLDTQPGYGFYPTTMWRPGELVYDRYALALDDGTPPGSQYSLDVTLYESASLKPIGTARISNIVVALPTVRRDYQVMQLVGPAIALVEAELPLTELHSGEGLPLLFKWAAVAPIQADYQCLLRLVDSSGHAVAEQRLPLSSEYPTSQWPAHAVVTGRYSLPIQRETPAGAYSLAVTVLDSAGQEVGRLVLPTTVQVTTPTRNFAIPDMQRLVSADFGGCVRLLGYDLQRSETSLLLTLHWQALSTMDRDYTVFIHLFDPGTERIAAQQDILAGGEGHPTSQWVSQEVVASAVTLSLDGVPAGSFTLGVGVYHSEQRLPLTAPSIFVVSSDRLLLTDRVQVP